MAQIHPTALVDPAAELAEDASIGPFCHVGPQVRIGPGTRLISHVAVYGPAVIGAHNTIWPQAVLGADPQDLKFRGEDSRVIIGDDNVIRESVTIHRGTANGGGVTRVGSHNLIMVGAHIAHDCLLGDHIVMANNVALAGHVEVQDWVSIGGIVGVHHFVTFGQHCFVGGMSRIVNDVPPYMLFEGNPGRVRGVNVIGLERRGFSPPTIACLKEAYRALFRRAPGEAGDDGRSVAATQENLDRLEREYATDPCIVELVRFVRRKTQGLYGRYRELSRPDCRRPSATQ